MEAGATRQALAASIRADGGAALIRRSVFVSPAFHPFDLPLLLPPNVKYVGPVLAGEGAPLTGEFLALLSSGPTVLFRSVARCRLALVAARWQRWGGVGWGGVG